MGAHGVPGYFASDHDIGGTTFSCLGETALVVTILADKGAKGVLGESYGRPILERLVGSTSSNRERGTPGATGNTF